MDFLIEKLLGYIHRSTACLFKKVVLWMESPDVSSWDCTEATVTDQPSASSYLGCPSVEFAYSYRVGGELYTGLHKEPFLKVETQRDFIERFPGGRRFLVHVKPNNPEISRMLERDQAMCVAKSHMPQPPS